VPAVADRLRSGSEGERLLGVDLGAAGEERLEGDRLREAPLEADRQAVVEGEGGHVLEAEERRRHGVVAQLGTTVERQVIAEEVDVGLE
jgi:hypothetical protein